MTCRVCLIGFSLIALNGCICIPLVEHPQTPGGQEVRSLVGDGRSKRPIQIGVTTHSQAMQILGEPHMRTLKDVAIGYEYVVRAERWIDPLVVTGAKVIFPLHHPYTPAYYYLFLSFDPGSGVVSRFLLHRDEHGWMGGNADGLWHEFIRPVPDQDAATTKPAPGFSGD